MLLKEISERLGSEEYNLIDTTLRQFSLPWSEMWSGTTRSYILAMADNASDQQLIDLAAHLGYLFETASPNIEPPFWRKGMLRLFVSHLATHRKYAAELQEALLPFGISAFVAHNDIEPTSEWQAEIETALSTCEALVALLHPKFHESKWTDQEIGFAMGRGVSVCGVNFGELPYGFIGRFQAFDGGNRSGAQVARELFDSYQKNKRTERRMAEVLVSLFQQSESFSEARMRIGYLEGLHIWESSFSKRVAAAAESNLQISDAWGVPDRVRKLLEKQK